MSSRTAPTRLGNRERVVGNLPAGIRLDPKVALLLDAPDASPVADAVIAWGQARAAHLEARAHRDQVATKFGVPQRALDDLSRWPTIHPEGRDALVIAGLELAAAEKVERSAQVALHRVMVEVLTQPSTRRWLSQRFAAVAETYEGAIDAMAEAEAEAVAMASLALEVPARDYGPARNHLLGLSGGEVRRVPTENLSNCRRLATLLVEGIDDDD
jgi:hypothetical protein